jgi:hypothetical protein
MSDTKKVKVQYLCRGATPAKGKRITSRYLRRVSKLALSQGKDWAHVQDRNRGYGGSKDPDHGWDYFGDGKANPFRRRSWLTDRELNPLHPCNR